MRRAIAVGSVVLFLVGGTVTAAQGSVTVPSVLLNSMVTQRTVDRTICRSGWTRLIRPSSSYTNRLKMAQLGDDMQYKDKDPSHYEEDHLIPLELGGNPTEPNNLWPEPIDDARKKDKVENSLHRDVCAHRMTLAQAQHQMYAWKR